MATDSKLHEVWGGAKERLLRVHWSAVLFFVGGLFWRVICVAKEGVLRIHWSAVVLFVGGLIWRAILALGCALRFVAQLIETFDAVARAPATVEELSPPGPPPLEAVNLCLLKQEGALDLGFGDVAAEGGNWAPRAKIEQGPVVRVHQPHVRPGIRNRVVELEHVEPSEALDPTIEIYIPRFHCEIYCHRVWKKYYAIYVGRQPSIYNCWECAKLQVEGYSGQEHKSFPVLLAAEEYFRVKLHCHQHH